MAYNIFDPEEYAQNDRKKSNAEVITVETVKVREYVIRRLKDSGWSDDAAQSVAELNQEVFRSLYKDNELEPYLQKLTRLGKAEYQYYLERFPEMAALMGSVLDVDPDGARNIAATMEDNELRQACMVSIYQMNATPEDVALIARLFKNKERRNQLITLIIHNVTYMEMWTYFGTLERISAQSPEAGAIYQAWLYHIFSKLRNCPADTQEASIYRSYLAFFS
ncbi:MAG: hypothetical protein Q4C70_12225, partial [Planctomycetia bacterium]|nr:hypothetical protein [Planctomycetia bacterium]